MAVLSVNQLVSETRKAVLGKGYSFGIAEDIARAIQFLTRYDIVPDDDVMRFLSAPVEEGGQQPQHSGKIVRQTAPCTVTDVVAALDYYEALEADELQLSGLLYPRLSCGLIGKSATPLVGQFSDKTGALVSHIAKQASESLILYRTPYTPFDVVQAPMRVAIAEPAYDMLKHYAFQTYVPSSAQSRAAGAGAGLHDND